MTKGKLSYWFPGSLVNNDKASVSLSRPDRSADGLGEFFRTRALGYERGCPGSEHLGSDLAFGLNGKADHLDLRKIRGYFPRSLDAAHPRHVYVHEHHIRFRLTGKMHRLHAVLS